MILRAALTSVSALALGACATVTDSGRTAWPETRSKAFIPDKTQTQTLLEALPAVAADEQARGQETDERTDIFSLGVLLYEMIAHRTPFAGGTMSETFANLINQEPEPLSRFAENVPPELQRIVAKMLRKNADDRYQTMRDIFTDMREFRDTLTAGLARMLATLTAVGTVRAVDPPQAGVGGDRAVRAAAVLGPGTAGD